MRTPHFTDEHLHQICTTNSPHYKTDLEQQLANFIIDDRKAFRQLIKEIEPMAQNASGPKGGTFSRQIDLIKARL